MSTTREHEEMDGWPCREFRKPHEPHEGTTLVRDMPDGSIRVAHIDCPGTDREGEPTHEPKPKMTSDIRLKVLYSFLGTISGLHENLDHLRHFPKGSMGAIGAAAGTPEFDFDYNVEMAQQSLEVASMRLQQAVAITDPEICSTPRCSDDRGPCTKHA